MQNLKRQPFDTDTYNRDKRERETERVCERERGREMYLIN